MQKNTSIQNLYRKNIGRIGEDLALAYLLEKGFEFVDKNIIKWGSEIDIVVKNKSIFHVIEVKTSKSNINPLEHINTKKLRTLQKAGEYYLRFTLKTQEPFVLSIISINLNQDNSLKNIVFLENIEI